MRKSGLLLFVLVCVLAGLCYFLTINPTVDFIDSGELALVCKYLGIAHPTGYPLYSILGHIAAVVFPGTLIQRVNYLSLIFASLACGFLFLLFRRLLSGNKANGIENTGVAFSVALFSALTSVWWAQGTTNEVYSLNLLLITIFLYFLAGYLNDSEKPYSQLAAGLYFLGLSLTNHLSAVYLIPGLAYIIILDLVKKRLSRPALLTGGLFFLFPITIYLFLPIRSSFTPFLNWGNVSDPYFFYKHISGWQYRVWMFNSEAFSAISKHISDSAGLLYSQFGWFGLVGAAAGLAKMAFRRDKFVIFLLVTAFFNLLYVSNYDIPDIDSYYLPMIIVLAIFFAAGLRMFLGLIKAALPRNILANIVIWGVVILLPLANFFDNFYESDRSGRTFARQGAIDIVDSMEPGGLAFVENWDFYSPWLYLRYGEGYRDDIILLDKELMRRSWYIDFVRRQYPDLYRRSQVEIENFLKIVEPFERSQPFNPIKIDAAWYGMFKAIITNESAVRTVYTNVVADPKFNALANFEPYGILFRFSGQPEYHESPLFKFDEAYWANRFVYRGKRVAQQLAYYKRAFGARERYCFMYKRMEESKYYSKLVGQVNSAVASIDSEYQ